jgi:DNA-binding PadR family transcriptional regulator
MGRGLSGLQRCILMAAYGEESNPRGSVSSAEVLRIHEGFTPERRQDGIDAAHYAAAHAALSRAGARLEARGLVTRSRSRSGAMFTLTPAGAQLLMMHSDERADTVDSVESATMTQAERFREDLVRSSRLARERDEQARRVVFLTRDGRPPDTSMPAP